MPHDFTFIDYVPFRRDTSAAYALLSQSVALGPTGARARTALATLTLSRGDTAATIRLLRAGVALDPSERVWEKELHTLDVRR